MKYYVSIKDQLDILIQIEHLFKMLTAEQQFNTIKILINQNKIKNLTT